MMATFSPVSAVWLRDTARGRSCVCGNPGVRRRNGLWWGRPDTLFGVVLACLAVFGVGHGAVNAPITYTTVSGHARSQPGWRPRWPTTAGRSVPPSASRFVGSVLKQPEWRTVTDRVRVCQSSCSVDHRRLGLRAGDRLVTTGRWGQGTTRRVSTCSLTNCPRTPRLEHRQLNR